MLLMASARNRVTRSFAWDRASESFDRYVTATIVKNTGTVSSTNNVRMVGRSRSFLLKRPFIGGPPRPRVSRRVPPPPARPAAAERKKTTSKGRHQFPWPAQRSSVGFYQQRKFTL